MEVDATKAETNLRYDSPWKKYSVIEFSLDDEKSDDDDDNDGERDECDDDESGEDDGSESSLDCN